MLLSFFTYKKPTFGILPLVPITSFQAFGEASGIISTWGLEIIMLLYILLILSLDHSKLIFISSDKQIWE